MHCIAHMYQFSFRKVPLGKETEKKIPPSPQWSCLLHRILCAKFEKMKTNEKSQTRITLHSHLLQQLGLKPLHVGSAG